VLVYCVNDGAVMSAWGEAMGIEGSMITFLADTRSELTQALGVVLDHPGPMAVLGNPRSKRFAMYLDDGVIKVFETSEKPDDPAGDDFPESSCVDNMLEQISKVL
jgi:peroxiredoxin